MGIGSCHGDTEHTIVSGTGNRCHSMSLSEKPKDDQMTQMLASPAGLSVTAAAIHLDSSSRTSCTTSLVCNAGGNHYHVFIH